MKTFLATCVLFLVLVGSANAYSTPTQKLKNGQGAVTVTAVLVRVPACIESARIKRMYLTALYRPPGELLGVFEQLSAYNACALKSFWIKQRLVTRCKQAVHSYCLQKAHEKERIIYLFIPPKSSELLYELAPPLPEE